MKNYVTVDDAERLAQEIIEETNSTKQEVNMEIKPVVPVIYFVHDVDCSIPDRPGVWFYSPKKEYDQILYVHIAENYRQKRWAGRTTCFNDDRLTLTDFGLSINDAGRLNAKNVNYFLYLDEGLNIWGYHFIDKHYIVSTVPEFVFLYNVLKFIDLEQKKFRNNSNKVFTELGEASIDNVTDNLLVKFEGRVFWIDISLATIPELIEYYGSVVATENECAHFDYNEQTKKDETYEYLKERISLLFHLLIRNEIGCRTLEKVVDVVTDPMFVGIAPYSHMEDIQDYCQELAERVMRLSSDKS